MKVTVFLVYTSYFKNDTYYYILFKFVSKILAYHNYVRYSLSAYNRQCPGIMEDLIIRTEYENLHRSYCQCWLQQRLLRSRLTQTQKQGKMDTLVMFPLLHESDIQLALATLLELAILLQPYTLLQLDTLQVLDIHLALDMLIVLSLRQHVKR